MGFFSSLKKRLQGAAVVAPMMVLLLVIFSMGEAYAQRESGVLLAGVPANFPPQYSIDNATGKPAGFAIDIMDEVARKAGINVRYVVYPTWPRTIEAIGKGEIDLIPNIGITAGRDSSMDFTSPVETFDIVIFVRGTTIDIHGVEDLFGREVAVVKANMGLDLMEERGGSNLLIFGSQEEAFLSLISGKTDALVFPRPPILELSRKTGLEARIKTVGKPLLEVKRGMAVGQGNHELRKRLDDALNAFINTERYSEIYAKWYGTPEPYWTVKRVVVTGSVLLALSIVTLSLWRYRSLLHLNEKLRASIEVRKKSEEKLLDKTEELDRYFTNALDLFCIADTDGYFRRVNKQWETTLGYRLEELEGKRFLDFVHPEDRKATLETVSRLEEHEVLEFINRYRCKDGSYRWIEWRSTPSGKLIHAAARDITERKGTENALRESEEKIRQILDSTAEGICGLDLEGNCSYCNPAALEILGYHDEKDLIDGSIHELIHHTKADGTPYPVEECAVNKAIRRGEYYHDDKELLWRADGSGFHAEYWVHPIVREGKAIGAVYTFVDIAGRVNIENQLRQAQKMEAVGRLAGGVAHDFNNMLNVILGYSEMALGRLDPGAPLARDLQEIRKAGQRSAELTRQLLAFSRKQIAVPIIMNLDNAIADEVKMLRRLVGEDLRIDSIPFEGLWNIRIDPSQLSQILANLAVNARDAVAGVGTITIETTNTALDGDFCREHDFAIPGEYVMLAFTDTGKGMDSATLKRIYEPFFTTKEVGKGTGLGLSMVYGIVKQNGGVITAHSKPGVGTTFRIYFPRVREDAAEDIEPATEAVSVGAETVLLVEDEEQILSLAVRILEEQGYRVLSTRSPEEACRLAERHDGKIDMLLTDVVMPEMNGKELQGRIAALRPGIRTLFMSGYTADAIAHRGVLDEGVAFVQKPFTVRSLAEKVRTVLDA